MGYDPEHPDAIGHPLNYRPPHKAVDEGVTVAVSILKGGDREALRACLSNILAYSQPQIVLLVANRLLQSADKATLQKTLEMMLAGVMNAGPKQ